MDAQESPLPKGALCVAECAHCGGTLYPNYRDLADATARAISTSSSRVPIVCRHCEGNNYFSFTRAFFVMLAGVVGGALVGALVAVIAFRCMEECVRGIEEYVLQVIAVGVFIVVTIAMQGFINVRLNLRYLRKGGKLQRWRNNW